MQVIAREKSESMGQLERATAVIDQTMSELWEPGDWPDPVPLTGQTRKPEPYPLEDMPGELREAIKEVQETSQAPLAMVATCALSTLSLAAQGLARVERDSQLSGPISLFTITFADSGERKTTADSFFSAPIRAYEMEQAEAMKSDVSDWKADHQGWIAKKEGLLAEIRRDAKKPKPGDELDQRLRQLEQDEPKEPKVPRLIYGDITPEQLAFALAKKYPTAGIISSEAGVVFGGHSMNNDSAMRNLSALNVFWDGGDHNVDRRTSESFAVRNASLTMSLQVQVDVFAEFMRKAGGLARGGGFLARFLVAWPESTQGTRLYREPDPNMPRLAAYRRRITEILNMPLTFDDTGDGLHRVTLKLDKDAKDVWTGYYNLVESQLKDGDEYRAIRDVASKSADNAARIAALFHVYQHGVTGQIQASDMQAACKVALWHLNESRRLLGELDLSPNLRLAIQLDEWLIKRCNDEGVNQINQTEVLRYVPTSKLRRKDDLMPVLEELIDADRVTAEKNGRTTMITINPKLLGGAQA